MSSVEQEIQDFVDNWVDDEPKTKIAFLELLEYLQTRDEVALEFHPRPGVTYSLRGIHTQQKGRPLFIVVDVIEGEPRWLSVCFYSEMISDPDSVGNYIPGGLLGEDGTCFDLEEYSGAKITYLKARIGEARSHTG